MVVPAGEVSTECRASRPASSAFTIRLPRLPRRRPVVALGQADAVVGDLDAHGAVAQALQAGLDQAAVAPDEGVAEGVGQDLGDEQADAAGGGGVDPHLLGDHVDADALAAVEMADGGGDAADVGAERHLVVADRGDAGLAELLVEQLQRLDAAGEHDVVLRRPPGCAPACGSG